MVDQKIPEKMETLFDVLKKRSRHSRLGSLMGGIVHNLNGSIQIVSMQMEMIERMMAKNDVENHLSIREKIGQCMTQIDKLKSMIEVLQTEERDEEREKISRINLNELIEGEIRLFHHHLFFKHHVKVKKNFSSRLPSLHGHEVDFKEGLSNLIENAVEAMEKSPRKELTLTTRAGNGQILVVIGDTGCGVPEELRPRLFTPFFTTKNGNHYGLGLFMARKLLDPYKASIEPHFKKGETFFSLKIPIIPPASN
ncbi:MAG: HAMP domain-containing histidine kinase [Deltaproteobacteria bacterium]|nr:HAMP domain-containing histidine kinase [Deltaproteobacteria bacterium]